MPYAKRRPLCLDLNVLIVVFQVEFFNYHPWTPRRRPNLSTPQGVVSLYVLYTRVLFSVLLGLKDNLLD